MGPLSSQAERALTLLHEAGYEAWAVGGCVRDLLLGRTPQDFDLTTSALPEETKAVFSQFPVVETGIKHGTVLVLLEGEPLEITTYRVDGGYSDARHPDGVTFTRSLREDAARRDFTMNAMAYAPGLGLRDYFGGQEDARKGIIRCVGDPETRFQEDALRILRGLRFASVLGFSLDPATETAARHCAPLLARISAERVSEELGKLLCGPGAGHILRTFPDILGVIIPELLPMVGFDQKNEHHCYDLLTHTAVALDAVPPRLTLRLAMLLHDVAKPQCFMMGKDGQGHFYGHAHAGMEMTDQILRRLRFPRKVRETAVMLVRYHDSVLEEDPKLLRRWLRKLGPEGFFDLLSIQRGDTLAFAPAYCTRKNRLDRLEEKAKKILEEKPCLEIRDLKAKGGDIMALGLRGPEIGKAQRLLLHKVLEGELSNEKLILLQYLKGFNPEMKE